MTKWEFDKTFLRTVFKPIKAMSKGRNTSFRLFQDKDRMMLTYVAEDKITLYKVVVDNNAFQLSDFSVIDAPIMYEIEISNFWKLMKKTKDNSANVCFEDSELSNDEDWHKALKICDSKPNAKPRYLTSDKWILDNLEGDSTVKGMSWKNLLKYDFFFDLPEPNDRELYRLRGNAKEFRKVIMYFRPNYIYADMKFVRTEGIPDRLIIKPSDSATTRVWYVKTADEPNNLKSTYKFEYLSYFSSILGYRDFGKTDMQGRRYETNRDVGLEIANDWVLKMVRPTTYFTAQLYIAPSIDEVKPNDYL